jgi:hypothetical protein
VISANVAVLATHCDQQANKSARATQHARGSHAPPPAALRVFRRLEPADRMPAPGHLTAPEGHDHLMNRRSQEQRIAYQVRWRSNVTPRPDATVASARNRFQELVP